MAMASTDDYESLRADDGGIEGESLLAHESEFGADDYVRKKNWPVCRPVVYHNIMRDVDDPSLRHAVRIAYYLWYVLFAAFIINTVAVSSAFFTLSGADAHWSNWVGLILSLIYFGACWPLSFVVYFMAYEGARLRSSVKMGTFFCVFPAQIILCVWLALGVPKTGGAGMVLLVHAWEEGEMTTAVLNVIGMLVWVFVGLASGYVLFLMWRAFRKAQASQPAQSEASTSIEDDDARDSFIDVDEEVAAAKAKEDMSPSSASTSAFSSWGVPSKINLSLNLPSKRERASEPLPRPEESSPPAPAATASYDLPANFLE
jgi:hypothetical protein